MLGALSDVTAREVSLTVINTGSIIGQKNTGGIAGYSYYLIQDCYNTGAIIGNGNTVGGYSWP